MLASSTETHSSTNRAFRMLRISNHAAAWLGRIARALKYGLTRLSETRVSHPPHFQIRGPLGQANRVGSQTCGLLD